MKTNSKTFAIHLNDQEAAILAITVTGNIQEHNRDISITDSRGYLIAKIHLAMDAIQREIHATSAI